MEGYNGDAADQWESQFVSHSDRSGCGSSLCQFTQAILAGVSFIVYLIEGI